MASSKRSFIFIKTLSSSTLSWPRLHAEMQALTFKETNEKIASDLAAMTTWKQEQFQFHSRQGLMDVRYMQQRFSQGKKHVKDYMEKKHHYASRSEIAATHAELLRFQNTWSGGTQPRLCCIIQEMQRSLQFT